MEQTASEFHTILYESFCKLPPPDADPKRYKFREVQPTHAKWESFFCKINSFDAVFTQAKTLLLTGDHTDDNLLTICIAKHVKK